MWVYLYPDNTETNLKNAYIWIPNPESIVLNKSSISLTTVGQTEQLTATIEPTVSDKTITWSSDDTTVATVSPTWLVTCVTPWECTITATTVNGLTASCSVAQSRLPSAYQEVEFVENTSTSWIDTGLLAKSGYQIDLKFYTSSSSNSDQTVIGTSPSYSNCLYYWINYGYNNWIYWNYNNWWHDIFNKMYVGNTYEATSIIRNWHQEVILDWVSVQSNTASCNQAWSSNMTIFARWWSSNYALIKLYSMQIYDSDNTLLRDFVPCYRIADGVIWLYDLENDVFYTNQWWGTFAKWNDV